MVATFEKTVDILVKAYLDDTLVHGNCYACAVGNLIAANMGYSFVPCRDWPQRKIGWSLFNGNYEGNHDMWYCNIKYGTNPRRHSRVEKEIESTGYTIRELDMIERAFEQCNGSYDERMFNGLMAVVDVLAEIHGIDLTVKEQAKQLFVKV